MAHNERALVTTLNKKMAEDLTDYLLERGIKVEYLHSDVDTLRRVELLRELREGKIDVIVGINLLREGLDLPEVSLVAILAFLPFPHPDDWSRREKCVRNRHHVCRRHHRRHAQGHRRDQSPP